MPCFETQGSTITPRGTLMNILCTSFSFEPKNRENHSRKIQAVSVASDEAGCASSRRCRATLENLTCGNCFGPSCATTSDAVPSKGSGRDASLRGVPGAGTHGGVKVFHERGLVLGKFLLAHLPGRGLLHDLPGQERAQRRNLQSG